MFELLGCRTIKTSVVIQSIVEMLVQQNPNRRKTIQWKPSILRRHVETKPNEQHS